MRKKTILYGNGLYGAIIYQNILDEGALEIAGCTADREFVREETFQGLPLVPFEDVEKIYPPGDFTMLVVIAFANMRARESMFVKAKGKGYRLENYISSRAVLSRELTMGENNIVNEGAVLGPFGRLGDNNMIRPNTYIGHGCKIHSHCYIAPGSHIGGECEIKDLSFVGIGATLIDGITLERETLVGAGSLVLRRSEPYSKYVGSPAKKVGEHREAGIVFVRRGVS